MPNWSRAKRNFNSTPQRKLSRGDLRKGDILIVHMFGGLLSAKADANFIRLGQALFSHNITGGSSAAEHARLIVDVDAQTRMIVCGEAGDGGIEKKFDLDNRFHMVYRCHDQQLAVEAAHVADVLGAKQFGYRFPPNLCRSIFRFKKRLPLANRRIKQVHDIVYKNGKGSVRMICSEYVVTCYEVAAHERAEVPCFNVDPRAMTAKALMAKLRTMSKKFYCVGYFEDGAIPYAGKK